MSMSMNQLMPDAARAALLAERFEQYEVRAAIFLHQHLGWAVRGMGEAALHRAIGETYLLSQAAGLRTESDHIKYLYAAAYWGIGFETDPQYALPLEEAGYRPPQGERPAILPIEPVLKSLERWQQPLRGELGQPMPIIEALINLAEGPRPDPARLTAQVAALWPDRCRRLLPDQLPRCIDAALVQHGNPDAAHNGQAVYGAMALDLGHAFRKDPFLPWAAEAADDGFALIHGLIHCWKNFGQATI